MPRSLERRPSCLISCGLWSAPLQSPNFRSILDNFTRNLPSIVLSFVGYNIESPWHGNEPFSYDVTSFNAILTERCVMAYIQKRSLCKRRIRRGTRRCEYLCGYVCINLFRGVRTNVYITMYRDVHNSVVMCTRLCTMMDIAPFKTINVLYNEVRSSLPIRMYSARTSPQCTYLFYGTCIADLDVASRAFGCKPEGCWFESVSYPCL